MGDIRYALRTLAKEPSFALAAIAALALGIAVNTIVFSLLNSLALRPMPVPHASRVVRVYPVEASGRRGNLFSLPDVEEYRRGNAPFDLLAAYIPADLTAGRSSLDTTVAEPRAALGYVVSANYFDLTGVRAAVGRVIQDRDHDSRARVAVLGYGFWRSRFGGDAHAVGATIVLNGESFTIVGVAAPEFHGTEPLVTDVWIPLSALSIADPELSPASRDAGHLLVVGRLRDGMSGATAAGALDVIAQRLRAAYPGRSRPARVELARGAFFTLDPGIKPVIAIVMAVVGLVLLVACANVANLVLARAASRQREIAVRLALGASRVRIARQVIVESLILSAASGAIAILLAEWSLRFLHRLGVSLTPFAWTVALDLAPDARVFAYTMTIALAGGLALGLLPALQASSPHIARALHEEAGLTRFRGSTLRHGLAVTELAAALVLLMAAGLLLRGLQSARALDLGFSPQGVMYADYDVKAAGFPVARARAFNEALVDRLRHSAGVTSVALTSHVPLHGGVRRAPVSILDAPSLEPVMTIVSAVTPTYFATLQVPILAGHTFDERDQTSAVVSEGLARRFWPGQPAIGKTVRVGGWAGPRTIVGVVRDAANGAIWREKEMALYLPAHNAGDARDLHLIVRTSGDQAALTRRLNADAASLDPDLRFSAVPLDALLRLWMLPSRVAAGGASALAALALVLAWIGVYGVVSFTVSLRMREIGIRMALGADARGIITLIVRDGGRLVAAGLLIGGVIAVPAAPLLGRLLFDVSAFDPLTMAIVPVALAAAAIAACYLPARRASRLQPLAVLRVE